MINKEQAIDIINRPITMKNAPKDVVEAHTLALEALLRERHGHWDIKQHWYSDAAYDEVAYCSCCNRNGSYKWRYCPHCGCKMETNNEMDN